MMVSLQMHLCVVRPQLLITLKSEENGRHLADTIFKYILLTETACIMIPISLKFAPISLIVNKSALFQVMA